MIHSTQKQVNSEIFFRANHLAWCWRNWT